MSIAKLYSRALDGMIALQVIVEVHLASGLPGFSIVGLPDTEVRESRDRVRSAIQNSGFSFPARRITVNLAPADLPKESGRYDLAIALGILIAGNLVTPTLDINQFEFAGELALDGELRPVRGALALTLGARENGRQFILPQINAEESALISGIDILAAVSLNSVIAHLAGAEKLKVAGDYLFNTAALQQEQDKPANDFSQIKGQLAAKKAVELAAAGRHSLLLIGSPGCGKSMLANSITSILPPLSSKEAMLTASLHSLNSQGFSARQWQQVPFRSPHHSSSAAAILGGGANPRPGEISLAHNGVLFLDELAEFEHKVLEVLREPLETKIVRLARARHKVEFAADFQLVAAMNPCPCGNAGHPQKICSCSISQIKRYRAKISGPLFDRIDIVVEVPPLNSHELNQLAAGESSQIIRQRVEQARAIQIKRQNKLNYELKNSEVEIYCSLANKAKTLLEQITNKQALSARSYYRLLKLARSVADLEAAEIIDYPHLALASQYKQNI